MKFEKIEQLERRNKELSVLIDNAERTGDSQIFDFKRELFRNKLEMIDLITLEEKRNGITARELKRLVEMRPKMPRYETGIRPLDEQLNGGIEIGTFIQLAGESFTGKTYLTLEILSNIATYSKAMFFNFEMGDTRIVGRLNKLLTKNDQWDNPIIDNDSRDLSMLSNEITLYAHEGVKFFVIDSKMKIHIGAKMEDNQKASAISKELSRLTQKHDIIIFLINQMSEDDIKNKRLAFKGSGDQQFDSDISLFYVKDKEGKRTLICNKNRQDEKEFKIELALNEHGITVGRYEAVQVAYMPKETATMGYVL